MQKAHSRENGLLLFTILMNLYDNLIKFWLSCILLILVQLNNSKFKDVRNRNSIYKLKGDCESSVALAYIFIGLLL